MSIETIRLSEKEKQQLITLKRRTSIRHWNELCRWAFCLSIAEPSTPPFESIPSDSSVEMSWRTFAGQHASIYLALLRQRAKRDGISATTKSEAELFRIHLHRGISYLTSSEKTHSIAGLTSLAL